MELRAETGEDVEEIRKLISSDHAGDISMHFPREDIVDSVKIKLEKRKRGF